MTTKTNDKAKPVEIRTDKGKVRCSQFDTHLEALGIPYAAPPLGDLRLRAPAEHAAWTDVRDATQLASASLQAKTEYDGAQGSEDCLYLKRLQAGSWRHWLAAARDDVASWRRVRQRLRKRV